MTKKNTNLPNKCTLKKYKKTIFKRRTAPIRSDNIFEEQCVTIQNVHDNNTRTDDHSVFEAKNKKRPKLPQLAYQRSRGDPVVKPPRSTKETIQIRHGMQNVVGQVLVFKDRGHTQWSSALKCK